MILESDGAGSGISLNSVMILELSEAQSRGIA